MDRAPTKEQVLEAENRSLNSEGQLLEYQLLCAGTPAETAVAAIEYRIEVEPSKTMVNTRVVITPASGGGSSHIVNTKWERTG